MGSLNASFACISACLGNIFWDMGWRGVNFWVLLCLGNLVCTSLCSSDYNIFAKSSKIKGCDANMGFHGMISIAFKQANVKGQWKYSLFSWHILNRSNYGTAESSYFLRWKQHPFLYLIAKPQPYLCRKAENLINHTSSTDNHTKLKNCACHSIAIHTRVMEYCM
jgi:hypothetical protein